MLEGEGRFANRPYGGGFPPPRRITGDDGDAPTWGEGTERE